jgi:hypothetical protein
MVKNENRLHWNYKSSWGITLGSYGSWLGSLAQSDLIANQNLFSLSDAIPLSSGQHLLEKSNLELETFHVLAVIWA